MFPYNADVIAVWANEIGPLQISNRYYFGPKYAGCGPDQDLPETSNEDLYESDFTFSSIIFPYNADAIAVWANEIGLLQISNRYYAFHGETKF